MLVRGVEVGWVAEGLLCLKLRASHFSVLLIAVLVQITTLHPPLLRGSEREYNENHFVLRPCIYLEHFNCV